MCTKRALIPGKHVESKGRQAGRQAEARLATTGAKSSLAKLKMKFEISNQQVNHTRRTRVDLSANNHGRVPYRKLTISSNQLSTKLSLTTKLCKFKVYR